MSALQINIVFLFLKTTNQSQWLKLDLWEKTRTQGNSILKNVIKVVFENIKAFLNIP